MSHRIRPALALSLVGVVAGISLPAVAAPQQPTRHVLVVLATTAPSLEPGQTAPAGILHAGQGSAASATAAAQRLGLSAVGSADGSTLDVSGPQDVVDRAFGGSGHLGVLRRSALGSAVTAVLDPDDTSKVFQAHVGFTGGQIAREYGATQPVTGVPTPDVASRPIVATIQLSTWNPASLTNYAQTYGVYANPDFDPVASGLYANRPVTQRISGSKTDCQDSQYLDDSGEEEVVLDQESILGVAPTLRQRSYTAGNSGSCIFSAYQSVLDDLKAGQPIVALSSSWGSCENTVTNGGADASFVNAIDGVLQQLVAAGVTVTAATGDYGKYDCVTNSGAPDTSRSGADYPASSVYVLAVGGTRHITGQPDIAWNYGDSGSSAYGGSGGGVSGVGLSGSGFTGFAKPSWQSSLSGTKRQLPDLAIDGDPQTGITARLVGSALCARAGSSSSPCGGTYGGTSLSAPVIAASIAQLVVDHAGGVTPRGKGLVQPSLYAHPEIFTDVTAAEDPSRQIIFGVGTGFDQSTGLGVPNLATLGGLLFAPPPAITAPATSRGGTIPVTVTPPVLPTGVSVTAWYVNGIDQGCTGPGSPSPPTTLTLPDGIYNVTARVLTSDGRCSDAGVAHVVIDGTPPTIRIVSWKRTDGSSPRLSAKYVPSDAVGIASVSYVVKTADKHKTVKSGSLGASTRSVTYTGKAGQRYEITLTPLDLLGPGKSKSAGSTLPLDDRKGTRTGTWSKKPMKGTYLGTVTTATAAGAAESATVTGSTVGVLVARVPDGGKAVLLVDGRAKRTIDLSAAKKTLGVTYSVKVRGGRHTVTLRVLGVPGATRKGTVVTLDGFVSG